MSAIGMEMSIAASVIQLMDTTPTALPISEKMVHRVSTIGLDEKSPTPYCEKQAVICNT